MKIDNLNSPFINHDAQAAEARNKERQLSDPKPLETEKFPADTVELSDRSRLVAKAQELANGAPDVREDKVNDLRNRIQAGTYNVSGQMVADSMLKKSITEV